MAHKRVHICGDPNDACDAECMNSAYEADTRRAYQRGRADVLARVLESLRRQPHVPPCPLSWFRPEPPDEPMCWVCHAIEFLVAHASEEPRRGAAARTTPEGE